MDVNWVTARSPGVCWSAGHCDLIVFWMQDELARTRVGFITIYSPSIMRAWNKDEVQCERSDATEVG